MGKPSAAGGKQQNPPSAAAAGSDGDEAVFLELSRELKAEATRLFNRGDMEGAAFKYDKAAQLLPSSSSGRRGRGGVAVSVEAARLRASVAQCYMRMRPAPELHRAVHECNLALEAAPRYGRAMLRRAECFEALGRHDLAWRDVRMVVRCEPGNRAARRVEERVRTALEEKGVKVALDEEEDAEEGVGQPEDEGEIASAANGEVKRKKSQKKRLDSVAVEQDGENGNHIVSLEKQADLKHTNGMVNHQDFHTEDSDSNGLEKVEQSNEMEENGMGNKRGGHTAGKKPRRGERKQRKHSAVGKPVNHCEDNIGVKEEAMKDVKLVFGEDIRCAQMQANCSLSQLREIVQNKFPSLKAFLIKYKDREGDLVTITSSEELSWASNLADLEGPVRLYVAEVNPVQELGVDGVRRRPSFAMLERNRDIMLDNGNVWHDVDHKYYADDWMVQFAQIIKGHVGFSSDAYLDLQEIGQRLYYEAIEDTIESEEAQEIFEVAESKFQEMAALALFNCGNVHMSRARKRPCLPEDSLQEFILEQVRVSYDWACTEYAKAGTMFEESVKTKSDFFEGLIALGQQQFEQAKLSWYYALACKINMETEVLGLFNHAEDNMEKGMDMWERMETLRLRGLSKPSKEKVVLEKMVLEGFVKDISADEAFEQASSIRSHINILWGTILYERSVVEFILGLPSWEESLTVAMEKFKIGGASQADINVIVKNHCANETTQEGLSFKVEEIVQAWNEMHDAKNWTSGPLSFRLQPIFRRRAPKLHHILEHLHYA